MTCHVMESLSIKEEKIIKDIWNVFRLQNKLKQFRNIKNLFKHEEEEQNYYKSLRVK